LEELFVKHVSELKYLTEKRSEAIEQGQEMWEICNNKCFEMERKIFKECDQKRIPMQMYY
jgi:hypothetical protein